MERTSTASIKIVLGMFAALCAWNVYRAATRDVTPSEAWNYDRYIGVPWQESFHRYDANNHVLNTLLVRISTKRFHLTELSLRLPSLLFGLLYLWAVYRLCRRLFGESWLFLASVALMTLNPLVVDALSEARGYGMAMAFWLWALLLMLECLESFSARKLNLAAACLALSVAGCLSFVVPALGLLFTFLSRAGHRPALSRHLLLPSLVFAFVLLAIPLNHALLTDFAVGATSLRQTLGELTAFSLSGLAVNPKVLAAVVRIALGLALVAAAVETMRRKEDAILALTAGTAWAGLLILLATHYLIDLPLPQRGAIYFIPVLTLTVLALLRNSREAVLALSAGCVLIYAAGFPSDEYLDGREFRGSREIVKALRADAKQRPVRIASSMELEPVVNYYGSRYRQGNWQRIERKAPGPGYDYYVLAVREVALIDQFHLQVIRRDRGIILAKR
jgi:hypothetical protein